MTLGRAAGFSIAAIMVFLGALWTGQGLGWIGGSSMSDNSTWAIIGPIVAGLGVALLSRSSAGSAEAPTSTVLRVATATD